MILLEGVTKFYRGESVLKDVLWSVPDQGVSCVLGRSGAGKTVLLKITAGIVAPDLGRVFFDGKLVRYGRFANNYELMRDVGFVFQGGALFDSLTVGENIALPLKEKGGLSNRATEQRVQEALQLVELANKRALRIRELSGGMSRLVAIARALVTQPRYLFLDEPTGGLDPVARERVIKIIGEQVRQNRSVVIVTHDLELAQSIAGRVFLLRGGQLQLAEGNIKKEDYESSDA